MDVTRSTIIALTLLPTFAWAQSAYQDGATSACLVGAQQPDKHLGSD